MINNACRFCLIAFITFNASVNVAQAAINDDKSSVIKADELSKQEMNIAKKKLESWLGNVEFVDPKQDRIDGDKLITPEKEKKDK